MGSNWNIEKVRAQWEAPWAARPLATVSITGSGKAKAMEEHLELLHSIPNHFDESVVYYTDGSQGKLGGSATNSAAVCQWGDNSPVQAQYWNLGSAIEVADAEVVAIVKALELAIAQRERPSYCYIFSDSQAAIQRLEGFSFYAQKAKGLLAQLSRQDTQVYIHWCPSHMGIAGNELAD